MCWRLVSYAIMFDIWFSKHSVSSVALSFSFAFIHNVG